jgi:hypothetical protein
MEHCERCGCRESHLGGNQSEHRKSCGPPPPSMHSRKPQQSALVLQLWLVWLQHVPLTQFPLQHSRLALQVPVSKVQHLPDASRHSPLQH